MVVALATCGASALVGVAPAAALDLNTTTTTLTASTTTPVVGQQVTFTATVAVDAPGTGTPTGTVMFTDNDGAATLSCSAQPLTTSGTIQATCSLDYLEVGGDTVVAQYSGDAGNTGSTSSVLEVDTGQAATSVRLGSSGDPSRAGRAVALRTTIVPVAPGAGVPSGTVTYVIDSNGAGPESCQGGNVVPLVGGRATCKVVAGTLQVVSAPYAVTVTYSGDSNFITSTAQLTQSVVQLPSRTKLTSSANPSSTGATVTYTALIRPHPATPEPQSGTVTFAFTAGGKGAVPLPSCDGGDVVTLFAGQAQCTVSSLTSLGSPYKVVATYSGDSENLGSSSRSLHQRVSR